MKYLFGRVRAGVIGHNMADLAIAAFRDVLVKGGTVEHIVPIVEKGETRELLLIARF